jgi:secreted trypsin-like serine protease
MRSGYIILLLFVFVQPTYQVLYSCNSSAVCGCSRNPATVDRIVGGEAASTATWGWAVSLSINNAYLCGGSIISSGWVVTAAHCLYQMPSLTVTIYAGSNNQWFGSQDIPASQIFIHPNYNDTTYTNDIALLELSQPLNMSDPDIASICMPLVNSPTSTSSTWPTTGTNASVSILFFFL